MSDALPAPVEKRAYVQTMFSQIARRYDVMNRLMTFGRDRAWRRRAVAQALDSAAVAKERSFSNGRPRILDVATGTGDLALEVLRQEAGAKVVGLDFVAPMLALAQDKAAENGRAVTLLCGDALRLPFPDEAFDAVVTAFALRNVTDIPAVFAEVARVTRRGGRVANLEIAKPRLSFFRRFFEVYFYHFVPILGGWITGQRAAYAYLPNSLTEFLTPDEIVDVMESKGWREVGYRRLMMGTIALHVGVKA